MKKIVLMTDKSGLTLTNIHCDILSGSINRTVSLDKIKDAAIKDMYRKWFCENYPEKAKQRGFMGR